MSLPHSPATPLAPDSKDAPDSPLDTALRLHFQNEAEPADDGFSRRVLARLPAQHRRGGMRWARVAEHARWAAVSLAGVCASALLSYGGAQGDSTYTLAAYALICLLVFWSLPHRWSRG